MIEHTAAIVQAYISHNPLPASDVPGFISAVHASVERCAAGISTMEPEQPTYIGAVSERASIKPDGLISMIDGKKYKMLKRHIGLHGLTPETYRERYGLKPDYPMVCKDYSAKRHDLAVVHKLGRK